MNKTALLLVSFMLLSACMRQYEIYTPEPIETEKSLPHYQAQDIDASTLRDWLAENGVESEHWPRGHWDIESLVLVGQFFSTDLAVEKATVAVAKAAEITADQKPNPEIELTSEYHSDREGGISPWTIGGLFSWVYEKPEKRQTRVDYAKAVTEAATLKAAEIMWRIRDGVVDRYLDVLVAAQKKKMLLTEVAVLQSELDVLTRSLELGQISDFEISTTRLALRQSQLRLTALDAIQIEARTQLALVAGLPADALLTAILKEDYFVMLPSLEVARLQLETLQKKALVSRPDIRYALAEYIVAEADLHREVAKQYPDITFSPGFIFDQSDNVWALAGNFLLPLQNAYIGPIAQARARRKLKAEEVLALQAKVLQEIHQARIIYQTSKDTLQEADKVIAELYAQQGKLQREYDLGYSDRLALIRNQREILTLKRSRYLLQEASWRAFAQLEDAVMALLSE